MILPLFLRWLQCILVLIYVSIDAIASGTKTSWNCPCGQDADPSRTFQLNTDVVVVPYFNHPQCKAMLSSALADDTWGRMLDMMRNHTCKQQEETIGSDRVLLGVPGVQETLSGPCAWDLQHGDRAEPLPGSYLDFGADPTGGQLSLLSHAFQGAVVGFAAKVNQGDLSFSVGQLSLLSHAFQGAVVGFAAKVPVPHNFGLPLVEHSGRFTLMFGDAHGCVPLQSASFDYISSINMLEHVNPLGRYLAEAHRLLKPGGIFYARWYPIWWSGAGHHVHEDMMEHWQFEKYDQAECIDGGKTKRPPVKDLIPLWSHLLWSREEMHDHLRGTVIWNCSKIIEEILETIYRDDEFGLNRASAWQVMELAKTVGLTTISWDFNANYADDVNYDIARRVAVKYGGRTDMLLAGGEVVFVKPDSSDRGRA